jgi:hypothetical protein
MTEGGAGYNRELKKIQCFISNPQRRCDNKNSYIERDALIAIKFVYKILAAELIPALRQRGFLVAARL